MGKIVLHGEFFYKNNMGNICGNPQKNGDVDP